LLTTAATPHRDGASTAWKAPWIRCTGEKTARCRQLSSDAGGYSVRKCREERLGMEDRPSTF
jgi:hypothetical protein